jgi:thioredoxin
MPVEVISTDRFRIEIFDYPTQKEFAFASETPIVLNFFATWCGPCRAFAPVLEQVADEYTDRIKVYKIDIDKDPEIAALFGVMSIPTTVFFKSNRRPAMALGNLGQEGLRGAISDHLGVGPQG